MEWNFEVPAFFFDLKDVKTLNGARVETLDWKFFKNSERAKLPFIVPEKVANDTIEEIRSGPQMVMQGEKGVRREWKESNRCFTLFRTMDGGASWEKVLEDVFCNRALIAFQGEAILFVLIKYSSLILRSEDAIIPRVPTCSLKNGRYGKIGVLFGEPHVRRPKLTLEDGRFEFEGLWSKDGGATVEI